MDAGSDPLAAMRIVPTVIALAGFITALICWPLIKGKIGPNRFYGVRTPLAFSSEENWYKVNRYGGLLLFRASLFMVVLGVIGLVIPTNFLVVYVPLAGTLVLVAFASTTIRILRGP
jgi:uncharacterized membrane protein